MRRFEETTTHDLEWDWRGAVGGDDWEPADEPVDPPPPAGERPDRDKPMTKGRSGRRVVLA
jgi:hypothetical protein